MTFLTSPCRQDATGHHYRVTSITHELKERVTAPSEKCDRLGRLVDTFRNSGQPDTAYHFKYVCSLELTLQVTQPATLDPITTFLSHPTILDFDSPFQLDAATAA
ncbi:hypothetical protein EDB83DRAFT_2676069 [Lactarius deliciosus]|nr:hypothetical protein EDB83DRAFT_2676069 [Lactarius deliciosus]